MLQTTIHIVFCVVNIKYISTQSGFQDATKQNSNGHTRAENLLKRIEAYESRDHQRRLNESRYQEELTELREQLEHQKRTVASLRAESKEQLRELDQLRKDPVPRDVVARAARIREVAFFALIEPSVEQVDPGHNLAFQTVRYNKGGAYDPQTGFFVAPVTGTYIFSMTITTFSTFSTHVGFALNNHRITELSINGRDQSYASNGQIVLLELQKSDVVTVQEASSVAYVQGAGHSMFSGFMLFENEDDS